MSEQRPYCLSIAGFDPSGGAGVLADIKTFEQFKVMGLSVVTCITFQNDSEFTGINWLSNDEIIHQLIPLKKYPVKAVKIGLIKDFNALTVIVRWIQQEYPSAKIVWDPVLKASAGFKIHRNLDLPENLLRNIELITPNWHEFELLEQELSIAGNVLIKGGHNEENIGTDVLIREGKRTLIPGEVFQNKADKHGTGCVLSSAIAAGLARGYQLEEACNKGKQYVEAFIQSNSGKLGYHTL